MTRSIQDRRFALASAAHRGSRGAWLLLAADLHEDVCAAARQRLGVDDQAIAVVAVRTLDAIERALAAAPSDEVGRFAEALADAFARDHLWRRGA